MSADSASPRKWAYSGSCTAFSTRLGCTKQHAYASKSYYVTTKGASSAEGKKAERIAVRKVNQTKAQTHVGGAVHGLVLADGLHLACKFDSVLERQVS